ncbi:MAG: hypothetical protein DMG57_28540 [Acidobacteria bacterium]|nr:MAG: hypothetical protein DMG57_28540 [Acidobacteriota bacterium]
MTEREIQVLRLLARGQSNQGGCVRSGPWG